MQTAATVLMAARRWEPCVRTIRIRGLDLTPIVNKTATGGLDLLAQVRLAPDTPGAPLVNLPLVATANTEGLRVSGVAVEDGIPVSTIELRINEPTMEALPFSGEVGDPSILSYGLQVTFGGLKKTRLEGQFVVLPGAVGSDSAPLDRPAAFASPARTPEPWSSADLTIADDEVIQITLDGAAELGSLLSQAAVSAEAAAADRLLSQKWAEGTLPGGANTKSAREWAETVGTTGRLSATAPQVVVNTAAKTITVTGRLVVGKSTTYLISGKSVSYDGLNANGVYALWYNTITDTLGLTASDATAQVPAGGIIFASFVPNGGDLRDIPSGYTIDGQAVISQRRNLRHGILISIANGINFDFANSLLKITAAAPCIFGNQRFMVPVQNVDLSGIASGAWANILADPITGALSIGGVTAAIPDNLVWVGAVRPFSQSVIGIEFYQINGAVAAVTNIAILDTPPENFTISFIENKIKVTGVVTAVQGLSRIILPAQEVSISAITSGTYGIITVNTGTGALAVTLQGNPTPSGHALLGAFRRDLQLVWGLSHYTLDGQKVGVIAETLKPRPVLGWDLPGVFTAPTMPGYTPSDPLPSANIRSSDIYGWFDDLQAANPSYITRTLLGNEPTGKPVYEYRFKPPMAVDGGGSPVRVMIQAGIHAERLAFLYPYHLMRLVAARLGTPEIIRAFRGGIEWSVMPCVNPWGIDNNSRTNSNGVDLNRNYPISWTAGTPGAEDYGGSAALSEVETQYSYNQMKAFQPLIFLDCHNFTETSGGKFIWTPGQTPLNLSAGAALTNRMADKWQEENPWMPPASVLGYSSVLGGGVSARTANALGAYANVFETGDKLEFEPGRQTASSLTVRYAVEAIANHLVLLLRKLAV